MRITRELNEITGQIVDAAIKVRSALGPGLLESAYEACLKHELTKRGLVVRSQVPLPVHYDEIDIEVGYRIDLVLILEPSPSGRGQGEGKQKVGAGARFLGIREYWDKLLLVAESGYRRIEVD